MSENNSAHQYQYQYQPADDEPIAPVLPWARKKAILSMIFGIIGMMGLGYVALPIVGLVMSSKAARAGERKFSRIGKITCILGIIIDVIVLIACAAVSNSGL